MSRTSTLKNEIVELLSAHHLMTVPEILTALKKKTPSLNKTTIYRNLSVLLDEGLICQQNFTDEQSVYELKRVHHDHVQCTRCGKVEQIPCDLPTPKTVAGFTIDHHHLTLFGLCATCNSATQLQ